MRLGRIILLASLAQLLGLSALAAALSELPAFTNDLHSTDDVQAWHALAPVINAEVTLNLSHVRASSQAVLAVTALSETSFKHSVWMVAPAIRTVAVPRPRQHMLLRC
ncbi:MAG: hypothetical protein ABIR70_19405 [Bryobacteraceae bacterium]